MICSSDDLHLGRALDFLTRCYPTSAFPQSPHQAFGIKTPLPEPSGTKKKTSDWICLVTGYFLLSQLPLGSLVACWWSSSESGTHMTSRKTAAGSGRLTSGGAWRSWLAPVCFCLPALLLLACLSPPQILSLPPPPLPPLLRVPPLFARAVFAIHHTAAAPIVNTPRRPSLRPCVSRGC